VIAQCQYYTGQLPLKDLFNLRFLNFLTGLKYITYSPARLLFEWFGANERQRIADQYNISVRDNSVACRSRIWTEFQSVINALQV